MFICPHCKSELLSDGLRRYCINGHSFDLSRAGYVNLLPPAAASVHGDNREMIDARRRFLDLGYYGFLKDAVSETAAARLPKAGVLLDAGCGEGYYTEAVAARRPDLHILMIDISKYALRAAARRMKGAELAAASLYSLPLPDASLDGLMLLFSPFCLSEFARVLKRGACLLMAIPARRHLYGLKSILYDTPYENEVRDFEIEGFRLLSHEHLSRQVRFEGPEAVDALFRMTPYFYRTNETGKARLAAAPFVETELSFELLCYEKTE